MDRGDFEWNMTWVPNLRKYLTLVPNKSNKDMCTNILDKWDELEVIATLHTLPRCK